MDWVYVWSPRYRFFHELLFSRLHDLSGFQLHPVFAEQHLFTPMKATSVHFLAGIPIKIYVIKKYIEQHMGSYFVFSDVDLLILPSFSSQDLEQYKQYDITCMNELHSPMHYNIGCLLIRCTPETLAFFERVVERIVHEKLLDQDAFIQEAQTFSGSIGMFEPSEFLQSNMIQDYPKSEDYKIIQCLSSQTDPTHCLIEKVLTVASVFDIQEIQQFLPDDVQAELHAQIRMSESRGT